MSKTFNYNQLTATYEYQFNNHFGIEPRLISSSAWRSENNPYGSAGVGFLKLKSGFLAGKMAHSYGRLSNGIPSTEYIDFEIAPLTGLIHSIHLRFFNNEKFFFGTELSMLTSFSEGAYNCDGFVWILWEG